MDLRKNIMMIVSVMVAVIIALSVLVPVIQDSSASEDTFTNEGYWRMKLIENGDTWTRSLNADGVTYDWSYDNTVQMSANDSANALLGDNWCVRSSGQIRGVDIGGNMTSLTASAEDDTITFTGSGLGGTTTQALSGYGVSNSGEYVLTKYDSSSYVLGDSTIYATGLTFVDSVSVAIHIEGTIDDGVTMSVYRTQGNPAISDVVVTDLTINKTDINGYNDLYELTSITATVSFNTVSDEVTTAHTGNVTYSSYVVPYEVTAERSIHVSTIEASLLGIIPLLVVIGIVIGTVWFIRQKN